MGDPANDTPVAWLRWVFVGRVGLRSGWRVLIFAFGAFAALIVGVVCALMVDLLGRALGPHVAEAGPIAALTLPTLVFAGLLPLADWRGSLGRRALRAALDALFGGVVGAGLVLVALIAVLPFSNPTVRWSAGPWEVLGIAVWCLALTAAATWEEVIFRGYGFQWTCRGLGEGLAWLTGGRGALWLHRLVRVGLTLASALAFGVMHLANPGAEWISTANTALAGVWFAVTLFRTRALVFASAAHFTWNATQGLVLGLPISGVGSEGSGVSLPTLVTVGLNGPRWLTGGDYGLEGGVACTGVLVLGIAIGALWPPRADEQASRALVLDSGPSVP